MGAMVYKLLALTAFVTASCFAAVPTISNVAITSSATDHTSITLTFDVSPAGSYATCYIGTVSGTYTAQTCPTYLATDNGGGGNVQLSVGGLTPSTPYFICPAARPNANNFTDQTNCATYVITVTTAADVTHPVVPNAPTAYEPDWPDTSSGYTIVPLNSSCVAASAVGPIAYGMGSWSVAAGDTIAQMIVKEGYGALNQTPQGVVCDVPSGLTNNEGYLMVHKAVDPNASGIDDPAHRWILFETVSAATTDFPPVNFQIDPSWTKMATFRAIAQQTGDSRNRGQILAVEHDAGVVHHYGFRRLTFTVDQTITTGQWGVLATLGDAGAAEDADYMILDQIYFNGPTSGASIREAVAFRGLHISVQNYYVDNILIPNDLPEVFKLNERGTGGYGIRNGYSRYLNGFWTYAESNAFNAHTTSDDTIIRRNRAFFPIPAVPNCTTNATRQPLESKRGHRWLIKGNIIDGAQACANEAPAMFASGNNDGDAATIGYGGVWDWRVTSNIIRNVPTVFDCMGVRPSTNLGPPDNPVNRRIYLDNNWAYNLGINGRQGQSGGGASSSLIWHAPGCPDFSVVHNTFGWWDPEDTHANFDYIPGLWRLQGGQTLSEGMWWKNNIHYLNYTTAGGPYPFNGRIDATDGQMPLAITVTAGTLVSVTVLANVGTVTTSSTYGRVAGNTIAINDFAGGSLGGLVSGYTILATPTSTTFTITTSGVADGTYTYATMYITGINPVSVAPQTPSVNTSGTPDDLVGSYSVRTINGVVTPYHDLTNNTVICGKIGSSPDIWADMTSGQCTTAQSGMPGSWTYAPGNTMNAREVAVGFTPSTGICTGCSGNGADIAQLYSDAGIVTNVVAPTPTATTLAFSYTSPDAAVCSVEVSTSSLFSSVIRKADSGGATSRTLTIGSGIEGPLAPSTLYYWRILCTFRQINGSYGAMSANWPSGQITEGSTSTSAGTVGGSRSIGTGVRIGAGVSF